MKGMFNDCGLILEDRSNFIRIAVLVYFKDDKFSCELVKTRYHKN